MSNKKYKLAVVIGRFKPFHRMHEELVQEAKRLAENVLILIGSASRARNVKNPFKYRETTDMIHCVFPDVQCLPLEDNDSDDSWVMQVQQKVGLMKSKLGIDSDKDVVLVGHDKDASTFYLKLFPEWEKHLTPRMREMDATTIRDLFFSLDMRIPSNRVHLKEYVSDEVLSFLNGWFMTQHYVELILEYEKLIAYRKSWEAAPFKPIFVTTDAVVTCAGHVLMVRRKFAPGKGLLALPGGFLEPSERIVDGIIRELKEETGININKGMLKSYLGNLRVFDNPGRSLRGRTITHAGLIPLPFVQLPEVKGSDDAEIAVWVPYAKLPDLRENIFEDHAEIIQAMTGIPM